MRQIAVTGVNAETPASGNLETAYMVDRSISLLAESSWPDDVNHCDREKVSFWVAGSAWILSLMTVLYSIFVIWNRMTT